MLRYYEDEVRIMALRRERLPHQQNKAVSSQGKKVKLYAVSSQSFDRELAINFSQNCTMLLPTSCVSGCWHGLLVPPLGQGSERPPTTTGS